MRESLLKRTGAFKGLGSFWFYKGFYEVSLATSGYEAHRFARVVTRIRRFLLDSCVPAGFTKCLGDLLPMILGSLSHYLRGVLAPSQVVVWDF